MAEIVLLPGVNLLSAGFSPSLDLLPRDLQHILESDRHRCSVDSVGRWWDDPTMTSTVDSKKRIVLPSASPGDVFDIQRESDGRFIVVRLVRPEPETRLTRAQCLRAIEAAPLLPKVDWATLRQLTREP